MSLYTNTLKQFKSAAKRWNLSEDLSEYAKASSSEVITNQDLLERELANGPTTPATDEI